MCDSEQENNSHNLEEQEVLRCMTDFLWGDATHRPTCVSKGPQDRPKYDCIEVPSGEPMSLFAEVTVRSIGEESLTIRSGGNSEAAALPEIPHQQGYPLPQNLPPWCPPHSLHAPPQSRSLQSGWSVSTHTHP